MKCPHCGKDNVTGWESDTETACEGGENCPDCGYYSGYCYSKDRTNLVATEYSTFTEEQLQQLSNLSAHGSHIPPDAELVTLDNTRCIRPELSKLFEDVSEPVFLTHYEMPIRKDITENLMKSARLMDEVYKNHAGTNKPKYHRDTGPGMTRSQIFDK